VEACELKRRHHPNGTTALGYFSGEIGKVGEGGEKLGKRKEFRPVGKKLTEGRDERSLSK